MISNGWGTRRALTGLAVLLVAACTSSIGGQPSAGGPSGQTTTGPSSPSTATSSDAPVFVERPREIPLDNLDPCELWTPAQRDKLDVHPQPRGDDPQPDDRGNLHCAYNNHPPSVDRPAVEIDYGLVAYLDVDVTKTWKKDHTAITSTAIEVAGFPAVQNSMRSGGMAPCDIFIGTAEGQHLAVTLLVFPTDELSSDDACAMTRTAAEMAMTTLQELR